MTPADKLWLQRFYESTVHAVPHPDFIDLEKLDRHRGCCTDTGADGRCGTISTDMECIELFVSHFPELPEEVKDLLLKMAAARALKESGI